ncbi:ankyrin repeat protein, partial [Baffinella frigidus]
METPIEDRAKNPKFLFEAATKGMQLEVKQLIDAGTNVNHASKHGTTALMFAVKGFRTEVVKYLLDVGADPDKQDLDGNSAMHYAVFNRQHKISALL